MGNKGSFSSSPLPWQRVALDALSLVDKVVDKLENFFEEEHERTSSVKCRVSNTTLGSFFCARLDAAQQTTAGFLLELKLDLEEIKSILEDSPHLSDVSAVQSAPSHAAEYSETQLTFPMVVMPMVHFQRLERLRPYPEVLASEQIIAADEDTIVHFVSHEWLSGRHPDPDAIQLMCLQNFFRSVMTVGGIQNVFSDEDWASFAGGAANKTHAAARLAAAQMHRAQLGGDEDRTSLFRDIFQEDVRSGAIWMDFVSIPQVTPTMNEKERRRTQLNQQRAISSIPMYLQKATYFYICTPTARHESGALSNFNSWQERGWCRMEELANFLSPKRTMMPIIVTEAPKVTFLEFFDYFLFRANLCECSVFNGKFKCCACDHVIDVNGRGIQIPCDKKALYPVLGSMYKEKLEALKAAGNDFLYRIYSCMEGAIFAGSKQECYLKTIHERETVEEFLTRFRLPKDPGEGDASGAPAIEWAAFAGHAPMVKRLIAAGLSADVKDKAGLTPLLGAALSSDGGKAAAVILQLGLPPEAINASTTGLGISALDRAAKGGNAKVLRMLLRADAEVDVRRKDGSTPLLSAVLGGHASCCSELLSHKANIHAVSLQGEGVLHLAAKRLSIFSRTADCRREVVSLLLRAYADPFTRDSAGRTPMQIAVQEANPEFRDALQDGMAQLESDDHDCN